jgi:hypothetical protein
MGPEATAKQMMLKASPGPNYSVPTTTGAGPRHVIGTGPRVHAHKAQYPDSSVDLTGACPDSQIVKYHSVQGGTMGTEVKFNNKNGEVVATNPALMLGMESPATFEHNPKEQLTTRHAAEYSFGPSGGVDPAKKVPPLNGLKGPTPRTLGPGSHKLQSGIGAQVMSARSTAPSWNFGTSERMSARRAHENVLERAPDLSSLGKQVVSHVTTSQRPVFGKASRDQVNKGGMAFTKLDRGPVADMPKMRLPLSMPGPPTKMSKAVGCAL